MTIDGSMLDREWVEQEGVQDTVWPSGWGRGFGAVGGSKGRERWRKIRN